MKRHASLVAAQLRAAIALSVQYRHNFMLQGAFAMMWASLGVVPVYAAFHGRSTLNGWSYPEALSVLGWFTVTKGVLDGAVSPSMAGLVEHIRQGTFDFFLVRPVDSQFLVSTSRLEPWRCIDVLAGVGMLVWAFALRGRAPTTSGIALAAVLFGASVVSLYSLWLITVSSAFWVVRIDNVVHLFGSLVDFGRWPIGVFRGVTRTFFTFVFPVAIMTTYPAEALLGRIAGATVVFAIVWSAALFLLARFVWRRALAHYTSASS